VVVEIHRYYNNIQQCDKFTVSLQMWLTSSATCRRPYILYIIHHTTTHNHSTALFPGPHRWASVKRKLLLDCGAREDNNRQTQGDTPYRLISNPPPSIAHFYAICPSCCNPPNLSWLGTGKGICWIAYPRGLVILYTIQQLKNYC